MSTEEMPPLVKKILKITHGDAGKHNLEYLANKLGCSPEVAAEAFEEGKEWGVKGKLGHSESIPKGYKGDVVVAERKRTDSIDISPFFGHEIAFGATSDSHLVSNHHLGNAAQKSGPLWDFYKTCARNGIETVFHGGNWVDGQARFNQYSVKRVGITAQIEMFLNEYPKIEGVTTVFIAGDDHEGWWWQREGIDVAEYASLKAKHGGRDDMHFIGYLEGDIALIPGKKPLYNHYQASPEEVAKLCSQKEVAFPRGGQGKLILPGEEHYAVMKLVHAGGGTSYAKSVQVEKIINSYESAEKPQILLVGHYHKASYDYSRNTHIFQLGTTEEQSDFMRKKIIPADVGSWLIWANQSPTGEITSVKHRYIPWLGRSHNFNRRNYTLHDGT